MDHGAHDRSCRGSATVGYNPPVPAYTEACNSTEVDPTHTGSVYAVFGVEFHRYGIPPSYVAAWHRPRRDRTLTCGTAVPVWGAGG